MADLGASQVRQVENLLNSRAGQGLPITNRPTALSTPKSVPDSDKQERSADAFNQASIVTP